MGWIIVIIILALIGTSAIGITSVILGLLALGCFLLSALWGWAWLIVVAKILIGLIIIIVIFGIISTML